MKKVLLPSLIALFMVFSSPLIIHAEDYIAPNVGYQSSVSDIWQDFAYGGVLSGSENGSPLTSISLHLVNPVYDSFIEYRVYANGAWQDWVRDFEPTTNAAFTGLQVRLVNFPNSEVHYQTYRQGLGWGSWVYNGKTSGNLSNPITGFRVKVFEVGVKYQSSIDGDLQVVRHNGETQGTGRLDSIRIGLEQPLENASLVYRAYFKNQGWTNWVKNWEELRSTNPIEAIEAKIEGNSNYHVAIQPYIKDSGWWDWVYDGATAGSIGSELSAYRIKIVRNAPTTTVVEDENDPGIGKNPGTTSICYSAGPNAENYYYVGERTTKGYPELSVDGVFDDNPAGIEIGISDQFKAKLISYTSGNEISVPDTFYGYGDNTVDNNQFEVYYGSYNSNTKVFTVMNTPYELNPFFPSTTESHTLILYDNDPDSNMILNGFILDGFFYEEHWHVIGSLGSRKLIYDPHFIN